MIALVAALWGALARLGWAVFPPSAAFVEFHGILMTLGFLGTLISLERAVALARRPAYVAPAVTGVGSLLLAFGVSAPVAMALVAVGGALFVAMSVFMFRLAPALYTGVMAAGALAWPFAAILWLASAPPPTLVPYLAAFLVLTIVGERLELARLLRVTRAARALFVVAVILFAVGVGASAWAPQGVRLAGAGAMALGAWLVRYDVARRTVRQRGSVRYIAVCALTGYLWLAIGGALWLVLGPLVAGFAYDASLHTIFVGYVMSMVLAHELIVVPAVLRITLPFTYVFYAPFALLETSLAARVASDAVESAVLWQWTGLVNVVALVLFAAVTVGSARGILRPA